MHHTQALLHKNQPHHYLTERVRNLYNDYVEIYCLLAEQWIAYYFAQAVQLLTGLQNQLGTH